MPITVTLVVPDSVVRAIEREAGVLIEDHDFRVESMQGWIVGALYAVLSAHQEHDAANELAAANGVVL